MSIICMSIISMTYARLDFAFYISNTPTFYISICM